MLLPNHSSVLLPKVHVGHDCRLTRCVIDKGCHVPSGLVVGENREEDEQRFYRSEGGVVLVTQEMLDQL